MCGERENPTQELFTLKDQDQPLGENQTNMQNLIFSVRRHWTFHLTSASHNVIDYSDAISKVIQQISAFSSVRGFRQVSYIFTVVKLAIAFICTPLQSLYKHFCTEVFIILCILWGWPGHCVSWGMFNNIWKGLFLWEKTHTLIS